MHEGKELGLMKPVGGGDPIPLKKTELVIGRRPSCDIRLDFENVSGRHCMLTYTNGTWHVRDLGSTNGTRVNSQRLQREQGLMPDDELAIASHLFTIDYEPSGSLMESQQVLEDETEQSHTPTSLMDLAGFSSEGRPEVKPSPRSGPRKPEPPASTERPGAHPAPIEEGRDDSIPSDFEPPAPAHSRSQNDTDEFFKLIEEDVRREQK